MRTLGPQCIECGSFGTLTDSRAMFGDRRRAIRPLYVCTCGAYVGCHKGTTKPLGRPAGPGLRSARIQIHRRMDPIWRNAYADEPDEAKRKSLCSLARKRLYLYLGERMNLPEDDCHTGNFDHAQCREAWAILRNLTYEDVRFWAHARKAAAPA